MAKPSINNAEETNQRMVDIIRKTRIDLKFLRENVEFRQVICDSIAPEHDVLDVGRELRGYSDRLKSKSITTLDITITDTIQMSSVTFAVTLIQATMNDSTTLSALPLWNMFTTQFQRLGISIE